MRKYLAGAMPSADNALKIARATGRTVEQLFSAEAVDGNHHHRPAEPSGRYEYISLLNVASRAGRGNIVASEDPVDVLAFKEEFIRNELHAVAADLRLSYVEGDSMEPDLRPGDIMLINHTERSVRREGIYVLRMGESVLVKQLQRLPGGNVKVISRNPAYEPFTLSLAELEPDSETAIIGRVVWACRRF